MAMRGTLVVLVLCTIVGMVLASDLLQDMNMGADRAGGRGRRGRCGPMEFSACVAMDGNCGNGTKVGTKTGGGRCRTKQKTFPCQVPCSGDPTAEPSGTSVIGACRYKKGPWGDCDPTTNTMSRTLTLKRASRRLGLTMPTCPTTKVITKTCKRACKYEKVSNRECDTDAGTRTVTLRLKSGDASTCEATKTVTKRCGNAGGAGGRRGGRKRKNKREDRRRGKKGKACKYSKGTWGECDTTKNMQTLTMTLRKGESSCNTTVTKTRTCKTACKYTKGDWTECDPASNVKTRADSLKPGSPATCEATRTISKTCKSKAGRCIYDFGAWAECNAEGLRNRIRTLTSGPSTCERTKTVTKKCASNAGKEKCFYGEWSRFGDCVDGLKTKSREVLHGGRKCARRTTQTKPC